MDKKILIGIFVGLIIIVCIVGFFVYKKYYSEPSSSSSSSTSSSQSSSSGNGGYVYTPPSPSSTPSSNTRPSPSSTPSSNTPPSPSSTPSSNTPPSTPPSSTPSSTPPSSTPSSTPPTAPLVVYKYPSNSNFSAPYFENTQVGAPYTVDAVSALGSGSVSVYSMYFKVDSKFKFNGVFVPWLIPVGTSVKQTLKDWILGSQLLLISTRTNKPVFTLNPSNFSIEKSDNTGVYYTAGGLINPTQVGEEYYVQLIIMNTNASFSFPRLTVEPSYTQTQTDSTTMDTVTTLGFDRAGTIPMFFYGNFV